MSNVTIIEGTGKESGKPYTAVQVQIGKWKRLLFLSEIEMDYVKRKLKEEAEADSKFNLDEE